MKYSTPSPVIHHKSPNVVCCVIASCRAYFQDTGEVGAGQAPPLRLPVFIIHHLPSIVHHSPVSVAPCAAHTKPDNERGAAQWGSRGRFSPRRARLYAADGRRIGCLGQRGDAYRDARESAGRLGRLLLLCRELLHPGPARRGRGRRLARRAHRVSPLPADRHPRPPSSAWGEDLPLARQVLPRHEPAPDRRRSTERDEPVRSAAAGGLPPRRSICSLPTARPISNCACSISSPGQASR